MLPLTMARVGDASIIHRVNGKDDTRRFLENLGFIAGTEITVLSALGGNVIVSVKDSRVAINQDMARHILVLPLQACGEAHCTPAIG